MQPATLLQAIKYFSDPDVCLRFVADLRWPDGITCPRCQATEPRFIKTRRLWECKSCKKQFSVKVGTIFEDSPIGLDKWLCAIWMIVNAKNGVSSYEIHRSIGVTQKTAWFMMHRIRLALQERTLNKLHGQIEIDETFVGGSARFMHKDKLTWLKKGTATFSRKAIVLGLLQRDGAVRARVIQDRLKGPLMEEIKQHVASGSTVYTDEYKSYMGLYQEYIHKVINHAECYAKGAVHTQGIENFWSLLKRGIRGTYVSVEPFHLFRYLDEQAFRFNSRKRTDLERFLSVFTSIAGRRVTYPQLIGQTSH